MKKVLIGLVAVVAILIVVIATRPSTFRVERSATIGAPDAVVFGYVNELKKWEHWSPWEKLDPNMKREFAGPPAGVGASYFWSGNDQVGEGRMTITESTPSSKVGFQLEFLKPWQAKNTTDFTMASDAQGTKITWAMNGNHNFVGKGMSMFMDMDSMVGADFEKGLAALKTVSEAEAKRIEEETKKAQAAAEAAKAAEAAAAEEAAKAAEAAKKPGKKGKK
jgi:hypothetical protein